MLPVPVALFLAPGVLVGGSLTRFVTSFIFYAVFSTITSTALVEVMPVTSGTMPVGTALGRTNQVTDASELRVPGHSKSPQSSRVEFEDVSSTYDDAGAPALSYVPLTAESG